MNNQTLIVVALLMALSAAVLAIIAFGELRHRRYGPSLIIALVLFSVGMTSWSAGVTSRAPACTSSH